MRLFPALQHKTIALPLLCLWWLLTALLSGCGLTRVVDGDGMVNTDAPLLEAIDGDWASAEGRFGLEIIGFDMRFLVDGEEALSSGFVFTFSGDINIRTDFLLDGNELKPDGEPVLATVEELYFENAAFTVSLAYPDGSIEIVTLSRVAADGSTTE